MENKSRNTISRIDWLTIILFLIMVGFGWLNIFSATFNETQSGSLFDFLTRYSKQFYFILASLVIATLVLIIDGKFWGFFAYIIYGLTLAMLLIVFVAGREVNGARSWIFFGPISLQPAELMKIGVALALAKLLSRFNFQVQRLKNLIILAAMVGVPILIILFQHDTGTALVFLSFFLVLFREGLSGSVLIFGGISGVLFLLTLVLPVYILLPSITFIALLLTWFYQKSFKIFLWGALIFLLVMGGVYLAISASGHNWGFIRLFFVTSMIAMIIWFAVIFRKRLNALYLFLVIWLAAIILVFSVDLLFHDILEPHQQERINQMLGLEHDPLGSGYNLNQSKIAIGSGGLLGKGFLNGTQTRFKFVPEQSTDFIFCTVGEEWGFLGSLIIIGLFTGLLIRLIVLAERQRSVFSRVYGYGVISVLFFHYMVNIGMTIGMMPVVGIPLPFFSYGGSSLWGFTILLFIFVRLDANRYEVVS